MRATRDAGTETDKGREHATVAFLLRRMRHKGEFPAFSKSIVEINQKLSSLQAVSTNSSSELSKVILRDLSLTVKILKVVNSSFYGRFSGKISTISKAMLILGVEKIRLLAASLLIFEHIQDKTQKKELKEIAVLSFMNGAMAMDLANQMNFGSREEAFICGMLHNVGKYLVLCHFQEEYDEVRSRMEESGLGEEMAALAVLGVSFREIGMAVLRSWQFPDRIVSSLQELPEGELERPVTENQILRYLANYSSELGNVLAWSPDDQRSAMLAGMNRRYRNFLPAPEQQTNIILEAAADNVREILSTLAIDVSKSPVMRRLTPQALRKEEHPGGDSAAPASPRPLMASGPRQGLAPGVEEEDMKSCFDGGIKDIDEALKTHDKLADIIEMTLETMYRAFGFHRVLFCMADSAQDKISARFGFGHDIGTAIDVFQIPLDASGDIFQLAISQQRDMFIDDASTPGIAGHLPRWYLKDVNAPAFAIFLLVVKQKCIGFFYVDKNEKGPVLNAQEREMIFELRNRTVKAMIRNSP